MKTKSVFNIGDEWLYYKIYCGRQVADTILIDTILPYTEKIYQKRIILSWFFIRYSDPDFHIRLRFKLENLKHFSLLVQEIKVLLKPYLVSGFIWDLQIHQYKREVERYGIKTIPFVETIFFRDSAIILKVKQFQLSDEESVLFLIEFISTILDQLKLSVLEKYQFAEYGRENFKAEFNANKVTIKQLNKKNKAIIKDRGTLKNNLEKLIQLYLTKTESSYRKIYHYKENDIQLKNMVRSIIHMTINRYFNSKQRLYEFLIYDALYKVYKIELHKNRIK